MNRIVQAAFESLAMAKGEMGSSSYAITVQINIVELKAINNIEITHDAAIDQRYIDCEKLFSSKRI